VLRDRGDPRAVAASIVRTECSPGATDVIDALALGAVQFALQRRDDIDVDTENNEIVEAIQHRMAADDELVSWMRDPAFATLIDPAVGSARTGDDLLLEDADWLTWSMTWAAVETVRATRPATRDPRLILPRMAGLAFSASAYPGNLGGSVDISRPLRPGDRRLP
jgi:hypothetical protein